MKSKSAFVPAFSGEEIAPEERVRSPGGQEQVAGCEVRLVLGTAAVLAPLPGKKSSCRVLAML